MNVLSIDVGLRNMSYCILEASKKEYSIIEWKVIDFYGDTIDKCARCKSKGTWVKDDILFCKKHAPEKSKKYTYKETQQEQIVKIFDVLDKQPFNNIDVVIIENQPVLKNPIMKTISVAIFSYFCLKLKCEVKFVSATRKMLATSKEEKEELKNANSKEKYKIRKRQSIECTKRRVDEETLSTHFNNHAKKDDLADAFLQAFVYYYY